ncbi:MBL fold metallo-hydrolase RNA specificity domain-containing protein [Acidithiobacillus sp. M4-SHS-6]|uniref:MBL fold metallo-hydrolase RNA specificity domain-containing protein n=1 Tax=Acidithiobacillus sp. M4-SHS-6 TaxID=3383024 RepID=UPI0039BE07B3
MEMQFYGAAGGVTGSCHYLRVGDKQLLIDCGLFQGGHDLEEENHGEFGFDAKEIDYLLLTHAHLDHCGRIPLLVKRGFRGEIITTSATRELARLVMVDSAGLAEEEARRASRRHQRHGETESAPLYDIADVLNTMERFGRTAEYGQKLEVCSGVSATFGDAGHILGSAWILIEASEAGKQQRIVYSGDLGNRGKPIINPSTPAPEADAIVMETTYGDRLHKAIGPSVEELRDAILDTLKQGGNVIIPTFALERAQDLLYYLREMMSDNQIPATLPVFLDSPMAISATEIFRRHPECFNPDTRENLLQGMDPFALRNLLFTRETSESMGINLIKGGALIMAGSGMATGGRVVHHLRHNIWREESSVIFVGYAAQGTLARRIIDGAKTVRIFGEEIRVAARIYTIGGFSAHADHDELLAWFGNQKPARTVLVHGEDNGREGIAKVLRARGLQVDCPVIGDHYTL